jgi:hypothetical protein
MPARHRTSGGLWGRGAASFHVKLAIFNTAESENTTLRGLDTLRLGRKIELRATCHVRNLAYFVGLYEVRVNHPRRGPFRSAIPVGLISEGTRDGVMPA